MQVLLAESISLLWGGEINIDVTVIESHAPTSRIVLLRPYRIITLPRTCPQEIISILSQEEWNYVVSPADWPIEILRYNQKQS